jgi:hypothetical protein
MQNLGKAVESNDSRSLNELSSVSNRFRRQLPHTEFILYLKSMIISAAWYFCQPKSNSRGRFLRLEPAVIAEDPAFTNEAVDFPKKTGQVWHRNVRMAALLRNSERSER